MRDLIHELVAHYADLRRQLTRDLKCPHHAADIAQSSFERVFNQALQTQDKVRAGIFPDRPNAGIESPRALLFRVARNLCIDDTRRRKTAQEWATRHAAFEIHNSAPSSEYFAAQRQVLRRVVETMEQLPPRRREVFLLFRAHGYSRAEIAAQLKITEMAVAKHMVRAALDCSRVFAELRSDLIEHHDAHSCEGFDLMLAEDLS